LLALGGQNASTDGRRVLGANLGLRACSKGLVLTTRLRELEVALIHRDDRLVPGLDAPGVVALGRAKKMQQAR
jgi:hypothetical protein